MGRRGELRLECVVGDEGLNFSSVVYCGNCSGKPTAARAGISNSVSVRSVQPLIFTRYSLDAESKR